jgi:CDP-diacylglycerol--glycerol-3-phosphate 3-phosphatidyltransferase
LTEKREESGNGRLTFTDRMRIRFKSSLDRVGTFLLDLGLTANSITIIGLIGQLIAAIFIARGMFFVAGLIMIIMVPLDALDGTMARLRGITSSFGAFFDSVVDRYAELLIFGGLLLYYTDQGNPWMIAMVFLAAGGSLMVSYTRARAEALGIEVKIGILTRVERYIVLIPTILIGYPQIGVIIVALLANITALQRILFVYRVSDT